MWLSGSWIVRRSLRAWSSPPSLPQMPTANAPARLMSCVTSVLTVPASTISTTSTIAASVTRRPSTKVDLIASRRSMSLICGPPPWTTIGLTPTCLSSAMSLPNISASFGSPIACPPYLTTTVAPA